MAFHVIPGVDEFLADIVELLAQRAVVADARPEATCQQEVFHYSLPACLGIACLVVHQQPPFLYILSHDGLVEWSVIVFVSCNYYHRLFTCFANVSLYMIKANPLHVKFHAFTV